MQYKLFSIISIMVLLASCAALPVVEPVNEEIIKKYNLVSFKEIGLEVGPDDGSGYAPVYTKITKLHYKKDDQVGFTALLSGKVKEFGGKINDDLKAIELKVKFISTYYESNSGAYTLNAELLVGSSSTVNTYVYSVSSASEMNYSQMMSARPSDHKKLANELLLKKMVKDISLSLSLK